MYKFFRGLFKVLFICLLICLLTGIISAAVFYLTRVLAWPWWGSAVLLSALAGGAAMGLLLYRYLQRRQEHAFVERVVLQDERLIQQSSDSGRQRLCDLQQRWLGAIATLRQSRLRRRGNPLYVLPWYLMLGDLNSGKSSAIAHSELTSILSPVGPIPGVAATRNCDWWFFEQSIVIDTAGRYAVPLNGQEDEQEWCKFLTLLANYRRREPLNGLIVTLSAEKLLNPLPEKLREYGRYIGGRLDSLIQQLGTCIPVYLVVTKADHINGFVAYANTLTARGRRQAFGYTSPSTNFSTSASNDSMAKMIANIEDRLQQALLQAGPQSSSCHLLLATELNQLTEPLQQFVEAAFAHKHYHEPVMLRGLYFTSACQPGVTIDHALSDVVSLRYASQVNQGLFLHELFARLLPGDRALHQPIKAFLRWRTLTNHLALLTVLVLSFVSITLLGVNYLDSQQQIVQLQKTLHYVMTVNTSVEQEILALNALRRTILYFEEERKGWHLLRAILQQPVDEALHHARDYFVKRFNRKVHQPLEQRFLEQLNQQGANLPAVMVGDAAMHLSWLLETIKARSEGNTQLSEPIAHQMSTTASRQLLDVEIEYQNELWLLYDAFVAWQHDRQQLYDLASTTREALNWLLTTHRNWSWIIQWISDPTNVAAVKADNFWQFPVKDHAAIPGAYTAQGRYIMERLLKQLRSNSQLADFDHRLQRFWNRYALQYQQCWSQFLRNFPLTASQLKISERRLIAHSLTDVNNPFFRLQRTAERELMAVADLVPLDLSAFQLSNAIIAKQNARAKGGTQGILQQGEQLLAEAVASPATLSPEYLEKVTRGVKLYEQLQKSLKALLPNLQTEATAAKKVADLFTSVSADEVALKGWEATTGLRQLLVTNQPQIEGSQIFNNLYFFVLETELALTARYLQEQWESAVYGALQYITKDQQRARLFGEGGLLTKFMAGPVKPFITRQADGWHPRRYQGLAVPFSADFFAFVEQGSRLAQQIQAEYRIKLQALPMEVNRQLTEKPVSATLTLQCMQAPQHLVNYNYPVSSTFIWRPEQCGDVLIEINFSDVTLRKCWPGSLGFADFLTDLRYGALQLTAENFPAQRSRLQQKKFEWIKLRYQLAGHQAILDQRASHHLPVPLHITTLNETPG